MHCPRCNTEGNVSKSPCSRCGLFISLPNTNGRVPMPPPTTPTPPFNSFQAGRSPSDYGTPHYPPQQLQQHEQKLSSPLRTQRLVTGQQKDEPSQGNVRLSSTGRLRAGRYRLGEKQEVLLWGAGCLETWWNGYDEHRGGTRIMLCDLQLPGLTSRDSLLANLDTTARTLAAIGRHHSVPTLVDTCSENGHVFFAFDAVEGESLLSRMLRSEQALPEQEIIECCLHITEGIEVCSQQLPPVVHSRISPEHLVQANVNSHWMLTNFSLVITCCTRQVIAGMDHMSMSLLYTAPDFAPEKITVQSDLYALLATAYYAVTGTNPASERGNINQAQWLNPTVSPYFNAILMKGLHPVASQRYQWPSELRKDLLEALSASNRLVAESGGHWSTTARQEPSQVESQLFEAMKRSAPESVTPIPPSHAPSDSLANQIDVDHQKILHPLPEELPPMQI